MAEIHSTRLRFLRRAADQPRRRFRRGVYLLPSLLTMGNMFCGYACVVYAMRGEFESAAPYIGYAVVLDMLDGRIARLTGTTSAFGVEFDSLADVISFGMAPAILAFTWGLQPLGRLGQAAEVAHVIRYLCSDEAAFVTGQVINVNGGMWM
jgi:CDP-diacylglycerol--serine O-phosphatidyltransferase